jgi:uncharacterized Rmd1/YagE family protein
LALATRKDRRGSSDLQMTVPESRSVSSSPIRARSLYVAERLDLRVLPNHETAALGPMIVKVGEGTYAGLFRYGAVVLFGFSAEEEEGFLGTLTPSMHGRFDEPSFEDLEILLDPTREERLDEGGVLTLQDLSVERLQVVAVVLAKTAVLAHYEAGVAQMFDQLEPLVEQMSGGGRPRARYGHLLAQLGEALRTQARTVGRVQIAEKPEITWDRPDLDRLYERLAAEYELAERDLALTRKNELISTSTAAYIDLMQARQTLRVEWYIVALILLEIVLFLYELFVR